MTTAPVFATCKCSERLWAVAIEKHWTIFCCSHFSLEKWRKQFSNDPFFLFSFFFRDVMMAAPHHPVYFWDPTLDLDCSCVGESISLLSSFCKSSAFTSVLFLSNPYHQGDVNHGSLQHCQGSLSGLSALFLQFSFFLRPQPMQIHSPTLSAQPLL